MHQINYELIRQQRLETTANDDIRDAGLKTPETVVRFDDILYGSDPDWQVLDVYRPACAVKGPLPVIVSIHGGGWIYGDKERYQYYCMSLAERGFAVVNFTYRLAPEFHFPASLEDCNLVFSWLLCHAREYGFNTERVFVVGDSAGGHLNTLYTAFCCNPDYAAKFEFKPPQLPDGRPFMPTAIGLNCAVFEIDLHKENSLTNELIRALLPEGGTDEEVALINAIPFMNKNWPPSYVMTANADGIVPPPAQKAFVEKLEKLGIRYVDKTYGTTDEPEGHVFHCDMRDPVGSICNDEECQFFNEQ